MKVHDFAWQVCERTMELLEQHQHYKIADAHRKEVHATILKEVDTIIKKASEPKKDKK
ncbi:MAG: hypothetical protein GX580_15175 [Candidatus Hydrogenedens sp.]|nr:hypothetical protein [Candidatus Hydrogenedentota bacterium]NLF58970.1 hypothetical protein [Candidatus Hydrogenedens sp.]